MDEQLLPTFMYGIYSNLSMLVSPINCARKGGPLVMPGKPNDPTGSVMATKVKDDLTTQGTRASAAHLFH